MEFERSLFKTHDRILSHEKVPSIIKYAFITLATLSLITFPIFLYAHTAYSQTGGCLQQAVKAYETKQLEKEIRRAANLSDDANFTIIHVNSTSNLPSNVDTNTNSTDVSTNTTANTTASGNKTAPVIVISRFQFKNDDMLNITVIGNVVTENETTTVATIYDQLLYSKTPQVVTMPDELRAEHNFTTHNLMINLQCYSDNYLGQLFVRLIGVQNVLINEIVEVFGNGDIFIKDGITKEHWNFHKSDLEYLRTQGFIPRLIMKVYTFIKILIGFFLLSNVTSIYIKITIICTPIVIMAMLKFANRPDLNSEATRIHLFRSFPWVGMYLYAFSLNQNMKKYEKYLILAFLALIALFYCVYLTSILIWTTLMFYKNIPEGLDESFYGVVTCLEFAALLFIRTRSSIKYFPAISGTVIFMYLMYVNTTVYGFYKLGLLVATLLIFTAFVFMLGIENQALTLWDREKSYTPTENRPRTLYFPAFSLNWVTDLPQLWTMFFPLVGREEFSEAELSYVDQNTPELNRLLESQGQPALNVAAASFGDIENPQPSRPQPSRPPASHQVELQPVSVVVEPNSSISRTNATSDNLVSSPGISRDIESNGSDNTTVSSPNTPHEQRRDGYTHLCNTSN